MSEAGGFHQRRRPRWGLVALVVAFHVLAIIGLVRAFAPNLAGSVIERAGSLVTVSVTTPPEPEPPPEPPPELEPSPDPSLEPDPGAAGEEGEEAVPREVTAPEPRIVLPIPIPAPRVASTGVANISGAGERGEGTGAGGAGEGLGSGRGGSGQGGGGPVTRPSVRSGAINSSRDFPVPEGGRQVRVGTSITVEFTVGVDGRASDCSVTRPGPDPNANALLCQLVIDRIRFNPAQDASGNPVPARYGWRQDFFRR